MAEPRILAPIELTDAELDAVSGGYHTGGYHRGGGHSGHVSVGIFQSNRATSTIIEQGGSLTIGSITGNVTFTEIFEASNTTNQAVTNTGSVTGNA